MKARNTRRHFITTQNIPLNQWIQCGNIENEQNDDRLILIPNKSHVFHDELLQMLRCLSNYNKSRLHVIILEIFLPRFIKSIGKKLHVVEIRWMNSSLFSSVVQNKNQEIMQLSKNESH